MKKSRFSKTQIMQILKQAEGGVSVPDICREHGMSNASFYKWRSKYGGMGASLPMARRDCLMMAGDGVRCRKHRRQPE